jgi:radical SAM protein with 4Fe4S-binding SPASM domain
LEALMVFETSKGISEWVRDDFALFRGLFKSLEDPVAGLHTYPIELADGRRIRVHLRVENSGDGILFVDVTDAFHLNSTAVKMAKLALDNIPESLARGMFMNTYDWRATKVIREELAAIYQLIDLVRTQPEVCIHCELGDFFEIVPLFGVPVNAPYKVDIALTYGCNDKCPHCYNEANRLGMPSLPVQDWFLVLDKLAALGIPHLILTGGEPTLHPDLPEIIQYADGLGMIVGSNSNGRRLAHKPYAERLAKAGLNHVQVTLGSHDAKVHNAMMGSRSFDQRVRGIQNALACGIHVITNTTLMRGTMDHVEEFIDSLYDLGIRTFAMNGMIYSGGGFENPNAIPEAELPSLLVRVRDYALKKQMRFMWYTVTEYCRMSPIELDIGAKRCNAAEYSMCIEPNGDVIPCQSYYRSAGNILQNSWESIWNGDLFRRFREREDRPREVGLEEKCWECPDLLLCGGGCRIELEARRGVRVATTGGGCFGCGAWADSDEEDRKRFEPLGGYVPPDAQIDTKIRTSGRLSLLTLEETPRIRGEG